MDSTAEPRIEEVLGLDRHRSGSRRVRRILYVLLIAVIAAAAAALVLNWQGSPGARYVVAPVVQGGLTVTVSATGDLAPVNEVDMGTEVSGTIEIVAVDNNHVVAEGDLLARLDTARLEALVLHARATVTTAEARVGEAQASLVEAERTLDRTRTLAERGIAAQEALDIAQSAHDRAVATLASAQAQVQVAEADLAMQEIDLAKAEIRAPISGVVLDRSVDPGQTVAASLQTPVLFRLAEDLAAMELQVDVDEADVGQVRVGQRATFSVDAYPSRAFPAEITRVRLAPDSVEGVVTYETLLSVDNAELLLRPGMTATAEIVVAQIADALLVPNEALRFQPPRADAPDGGGGLFGSLRPPRRGPPSGSTRVDIGAVQRTLWVLQDGQVVPIEVTVGSTDGRMTQVIEGDLTAGMSVITDTEEPE